MQNRRFLFYASCFFFFVFFSFFVLFIIFFFLINFSFPPYSFACCSSPPLLKCYVSRSKVWLKQPKVDKLEFMGCFLVFLFPKGGEKDGVLKCMIKLQCCFCCCLYVAVC